VDVLINGIRLFLSLLFSGMVKYFILELRNIMYFMNRPTLSRRHFLFSMLAYPLLPNLSWAQSPEKCLRLYQPHTDETLNIVYHSDQGYHLDSLKQINYLMRDYRTDCVMQMDLELLDILYDLQQQFDTRPFHVISGYRSPKTNRKLRQRSRNVAKRSFHLQGKAVDVCLPGVSSRQLKKAAIDLKRGGVGYYSRSGFVHLDTGPVRHW